MRTFADFNPIVITVYFLAVSGIAMFCLNPIIFFISLSGAFFFYVSVNKKKQFKNHWFYLLTFFVLTIINPLISHNGVTVLFVMNNNPVTLEALIYGASSALMIVGVMYWFASYSKIMTSDKLLYLFGALSPKLALILSMALRYVPLFKHQAVKVNQSQKAMGLYKEDNILDNTRNGIRVFSVLITWALENGIITADSMSARGYGTGRRTHFKGFKFNKFDLILIVVCVSLSLVSLMNIKDFVFYPAVIIPKNTATTVAGYVAYGVLAALPAIIEVKESVKWKYLKSKI